MPDPSPDTNEISFSATLKRPSYLRIGIVVACGLILLVSAAVTMAASPSPSASSSGPATTQPNAGGQNGPGFDGRSFGRFGAGFGGPSTVMPGMPGMGRMGMFREFGFGQITIASIDGSNLSLKTADGWTRTITVTSSTKITKGGQTIAQSDLKAGDPIVFTETRNSDGSYTIDAVNVTVPQVAGSVTAVNGSGFTLKGKDGTTWTVTVTGSTTYNLGGQTASLSDVKVGDEVAVQGAQASNNAISATAVKIAPALAVGQVTAVSGNTITIKRFDGTTGTVDVSSATTYRKPGSSSASLSDVTVGSMIAAEGTQSGDGSLNATVVRVGPGKGMGPGMGFGFGFGKGMRPGQPQAPAATNPGA